MDATPGHDCPGLIEATVPPVSPQFIADHSGA